MPASNCVQHRFLAGHRSINVLLERRVSLYNANIYGANISAFYVSCIPYERRDLMSSSNCQPNDFRPGFTSSTDVELSKVFLSF